MFQHSKDKLNFNINQNNIKIYSFIKDLQIGICLSDALSQCGQTIIE